MEIKNRIASEYINKLFQLFLVLYLVLLLVEQIKEGSISLYINLNYLLILVIVLGILSVFTKQPEPKKEPITKKDYVYISLLSVIGVIIIFIKTKDLGYLSYLISIIAGILIFLLSYLVLTEDEVEKIS